MLTPITITGSFVNSDGSAPSGAILFTLTDSAGDASGMTDSSSGEMVLPLVVAGIVYQGKLLWSSPGGGGYNPLTLLANDDPTTLPTDTHYEVVERLSAGSLDPWPLTVHYNAAGATLDISSQRPTP